MRFAAAARVIADGGPSAEFTGRVDGGIFVGFVGLQDMFFAHFLGFENGDERSRRRRFFYLRPSAGFLALQCLALWLLSINLSAFSVAQWLALLGGSLQREWWGITPPPPGSTRFGKRSLFAGYFFPPNRHGSI